MSEKKLTKAEFAKRLMAGEFQEYLEEDDQFYDYEAARKAGAKPDASGHWPSEFKKPGHPNEVVGGFNTRTGERVPGTKRANRKELIAQGWDPKTAARINVLPDKTSDLPPKSHIASTEPLVEDIKTTIYGKPEEGPRIGPRKGMLSLDTEQALQEQPLAQLIQKVRNLLGGDEAKQMEMKSAEVPKPKGSATAVVDAAGRQLLGKGGSVGPASKGFKGKVPDMPVPQTEIEKFLGLKPEQLRKGDIDEILRLTRESGGATWHTRRGNLFETPHYAVATRPEANVQISGRELTPKDIADYIQKTAKLRREDPTLSIGTWHNKDKNLYDLDLVSAIRDKEDALKLGYQHDQDAIFDLKTGETINLDWLPVEHRGAKGLTETDPAYFGKGQAGEELKRAKDPSFIPRTYFNAKGSPVEARFKFEEAYEGRLPSSKVYDLDKDPLNLKQLAQQQDNPRTAFERLVKDKGYEGYRAGGDIAYFSKVRVRPLKK